MKNLTLIAALAVAAIFTSCKKEETPTPIVDHVEISFVNDNPTKAFFDPTTVADKWESDVKSLTVLIFDAGGKLLSQRIFEESEVNTLSANFAIPNTSVGTTCEFYAVANVVVPVAVANKADLLAMLETNPGLYNSTFAQVSTKAIRTDGFVMSGSATKTLNTGRTNVAITLNRSVAKIAVKTTTTPNFANRYYGKVRVDNATISNAANQSNIIAPAVINPGARNWTVAQVPNTVGDVYQNLFYTFSNSSVAAGSRMALNLDCTYDRDGNFGTMGDQMPVAYKIELNGSGAGDFNRNGYYRIEVLVDGLTGADASATISVAAWNAPITQTANVGQ